LKRTYTAEERKRERGREKKYDWIMPKEGRKIRKAEN